MMAAVHIVVALLFLSGAAITAAWMLSHRLTPERRHLQLRGWLLRWSGKGLLVPLVVWALMNVGLFRWLQPYMPQVQAAQNSGAGWFPAYLRVLAAGWFVISSYWAAMTLGWLLLEAGRASEGEERAQFKGLCLSCFVAMVLPALLLAILGGWSLLGLAGIAVLAPMAGYGAQALHLKKTPPMYARAIGRMKLGKYSEAEWEIIRELEKCEDDFEGWMMLAILYANNFNDLPEAEQTILEICEQPRTTPSQLSVALHKLADWHLRQGDPAAARRALELICHRLPGSHLAHMAQLRINQLPVSVAELRRQQTASFIPLPALSDRLDEAPEPPKSEADRKQAAAEANDCVEILKGDPNNVPARERLARLFAERLDQPDLGIEQVTLLLDLPDQPDARRAEWLGLIAAWHLRFRQDAAAGRKVLERLIREFPQTPQALFARRRLQLLNAQSRQ